MKRDPLIGSVLHSYRIEALIGEGSAARVYRARHLALDRLSAIKLLSITNAIVPGIEERFEREARSLARMSHPNVVSVFDFGIAPDGRPFLTMELLNGRTLAEVIETEGKLDRFRIIRIARQLASGLAEAHKNRIVHRDLKPANIMLLGEGAGEYAKILDFGVARATGRSERELTAHEVIIGTPRYMAPEQAMNPTAVSPSSDLYSLGVILYEMLTGRAPFMGTTLEVLDQQMNQPPPPLTTETGLEMLVNQLLAKEADDRPPNAMAVIRALELMPDQQPTQMGDITFSDRTGLMYVRSQLPTVMPKTVIEEPTVPDDPLDRETLMAGIEDTIDSVLRTRLVPPLPAPMPTPLPTPPPPKLVMSKRDRLAVVLACVALVLGCSVVALAAVSMQRRSEPQVVVVSPGS